MTVPPQLTLTIGQALPGRQRRTSRRRQAADTVGPMRARKTLAHRAVMLLLALGLAGCSASRTASAPATAPVTIAPATTIPITTAPVTITAPTPAPPPTAPPATSSPAPTTVLTTAAPDTTAPDVPAVPAVPAAAWAVLDPATGELLAGQDVDTRRSVGSLMKLLTAYVVMEAGDPDHVVTAPDELLVSIEESAIGLRPGEQLPRDVLWRAMLIVSANDAARALAVDLAGSEAAFAARMTAAAAELGLEGTRAVNATGLDAAGQHSTARDMVALGRHLMSDPEFAAVAARTDARLHGQTFPATNDLLRLYAGADGIKTGHTSDAGWCVLASATRDGRRMIVAVLGAASEADRNAAASTLLDWAFTATG
jgi:D-alanyl-D-alanine carboxypeptidase (penicillin-binding protein 5/6)